MVGRIQAVERAVETSNAQSPPSSLASAESLRSLDLPRREARRDREIEHPLIAANVIRALFIAEQQQQEAEQEAAKKPAEAAQRLALHEAERVAAVEERWRQRAVHELGMEKSKRD